MIKKIIDIIDEFNMINDTDNIVVGISGGADSVCLLLVLDMLIKNKGKAIKIVGVHVNHGIRGEEALRDQEFSEKLCEKLGVECIVRNVDVPRVAKERHLTEEEAGRILRYEVFKEEAKKLSPCRIAVAHHMNDQAETVLMNMFRGSSFNGLAGMSPVRGDIIRPLLSCTRKEIEHFLQECGQEYITDSTNLVNDFTRNKLRNVCIPFIEENVNGQAVKHICEAAESVAQVKNFIDSVSQDSYKRCVTSEGECLIVNSDAFESLDICIKTEVIRRVIEKLAGRLKDVYKVNIDNAMMAFGMQVGKTVDVIYGICGRKEYDSVRFFINSETNCGFSEIAFIIPDNLNIGDCFTIGVNQNIYIQGCGVKFLKEIQCEITDSMIKSNDNDYTKFFDYDKIPYKLLLRKRMDGDRISLPLGKDKKLKKEFADRKIPLQYRDYAMMIAHDRQILWAAGIRRSASCMVDSHTKKVLVLNLCVQK